MEQIVKYLKKTKLNGLIMNPSKTANLDMTCYVDADLAGLWNKEDEQDLHCVRSRTGFVVMIANYPIIWRSKLQTEISRSTMESKYISLSIACRDLLPLQRLVKETGRTVGIPDDKLMKIKTTI